MKSIEESSIGTETLPVNMMIGPEEKMQLREELAALLLKHREAKGELERAKVEFKAIAEPMDERVQDILTLLTVGFRTERVSCFMIPSYEKGEIEYVTAEGALIMARPMRPEEKQIPLFKGKASAS